MSFSQYNDMASAVVSEVVQARNYNAHNLSSEKTKFKPVAIGYSSPQTYTYPYEDEYNTFVMIESSSESFVSFVYKLINPETRDPAKLLTGSVKPNEITTTNFQEPEKFLSTTPPASILAGSNGFIIKAKG